MNANPIIRQQRELRGRRIEDVYAAVAGDAYGSLLLSGGDLDAARFSMIGCDPFCVIRSKSTRTEVTTDNGTEVWAGDPFDHFQTVLDRHRVEDPPANLPISAGAVGYFAYELKNRLERLPQTAEDELSIPELYFCLYRLILIHDRRNDEWYLSCYTPPGEADNHEERMQVFVERLVRAARTESHRRQEAVGGLVSNFRRSDYLSAVERVRRYIIDGHVYQVNISQRFAAPFSGDPYQPFLRMLEMNPAAFYAFLNCRDFQVLCTSPERFLLQERDRVETRPIKGTRPRGTTPEADLELRNELLESAKDDAELSMIVDLLRNDLSKVCRAGTVRVEEHKRIEAYANVYHLVSVVTGQLEAGRSRMDLVKACFPGGSITGCPKIRAMEIIDEMEPHARGLYTGSIGYVSFHNSMDLNIAIRTAVVKDGVLRFNVGGGIVYDSNPEEEYLETLHKGESILKSLGYSKETAGMG